MELELTNSRQILPYVSALVIFYILRRLWAYSKLRRFHGSPWTALSDIPHSRAMLGGDCHLFYAKANQKYGQRCLALIKRLHQIGHC
jgi:hypothetical protein